MKIAIAVMAHPKRRESAYKLLDILSKQKFIDACIIWDVNNSEWDTGVRTWKYLASLKTDYSVVIQDDAIISKYFYYNLENALENLPKEGLLSLYLGRVKPYPSSVTNAHSLAVKTDSSYLYCKKLLWGVGIAIPTNAVSDVLRQAKPLDKLLYDIRLGTASNVLKMPIYYTRQSLVDHDDDLGSLIGHQVPQKRCAHEYQPEKIENWNNKAVKIF